MGAMGERGLGARQLSVTSVLSGAWPALLLATVCLLPFLNKPFLVDDPHFLAMARQIVKHPSHPMDFDICWNLDVGCAKAYALTPGNTLMGYALVPTVLTGTTEWMAHLTQLCFAWVAVIAMASLVLRLGYSRAGAITGALLLAAIPPFLPMASTAMPDMLATAMGLVAIERLAAWKACGKWSQGAAAGVALGLAGIARPHLTLLLPLGAFFLFDSIHPREMWSQLRQRPWRWLPILIGGVVLMTMIYATRERSLVLDPPAVSRGLRHVPKNLRSYLLYLCFPIPLAAYWAAARWTSGPRRLAIVLGAAAIVGVASWDRRNFLAAAGFSVLADLLLDAYRKRDHMGLFLMLWLLIPLPIVYYAHLPIKYLLPCMPAVILTCFRLNELMPLRIARAANILVIAGGAVFSILILRSDAEFAEFGRAAMDTLIRPHVAAGEKVWFGGQFSAYWYAPLAGAELVTADRGPKPGDLLAIGLLEGGEFTLLSFPRRTLVQVVPYTYSFGRTMGAGIGLYTNLQGYWLWGFGTSEKDRYELWRID